MKMFGKGTNDRKLNDWGMDVLVISDKSGLGGITIWEDKKQETTIRKAKKDKIQYDFKILSSGSVRSLERVNMNNICSETNKYSVMALMSAYADNRFSRQDVVVVSEKGDTVFL